MQVDFLADAGKLSALVEAVQFRSASWLFCWAATTEGFGLVPPMPRWRQVEAYPPQHHAAFVVLVQVDVKIDGTLQPRL